MDSLNTYKIVALNAYENDGYERLLKYGGCERLWKWWLWMPLKMVALNAYENDGGS